MPTVTKCLREIRSVRSVARGAEAAYVARSRVARLGLSVARLASDVVGGTPPERPEQLPVPTGADAVLSDVLILGNGIQEISEFVRQPSEPLDGRWAAMWEELELHLDSLERALLALDANSSHGQAKPTRSKPTQTDMSR